MAQQRWLNGGEVVVVCWFDMTGIWWFKERTMKITLTSKHFKMWPQNSPGLTPL